MPLHHFGVIKGRAINSRLGFGSSPHYQIHLVDDTTDYRVAINVKSKLAPSELLYLVDDAFEHPVTEQIEPLPVGYHALPSTPDSGALDFIRGNLFDLSRVRPLPYNVPGPDNDLNEKLDAVVSRAIADSDALIYAFGERWGPEPGKKDKYFGFSPGNWIHDIHMNQGNTGRFANDNGVWQDGGLLIHFPPHGNPGDPDHWPGQWVAVFLAFQSQAWHTDDRTGAALPTPTPTPPPEAPPSVPPPAPTEHVRVGNGPVRIVAALVNPQGADQGREVVTLINLSPNPVELSGWSIADKNKRSSPLPSDALPAGATIQVKLDGRGAQLGNKGGLITLLDTSGGKIDGVAYTKSQAKAQGWSLLFL